jgi:drug/metabolite transporter (DMT)-like permease
LAPPQRHSRPGAGIAFILLTAGCFAISDATIKFLGATLPVVVLLWARYFFQTSTMAALQTRRRGWRALLHSGRPTLQFVRAALLLGNASCSFVGLQYVPLAEFTALAMLAPMASTLLASTVLRERVSPAQWAMVVLGFVGMLVIVRPGGGALGWSAAYPLAGALLLAAFQIVTHRLTQVDGLVTTNLYSGLGALIVLSIALAVLPVDLAATLGRATTAQWLLVLLLGAIATAGQALMVLAIRAAPLSTLTPFAYVQIAFAAAISWLVFRHRPDGIAVVGMVLIALAGAITVVLGSRQRAASAASIEAITGQGLNEPITPAAEDRPGSPPFAAGRL